MLMSGDFFDRGTRRIRGFLFVYSAWSAVIVPGARSVAGPQGELGHSPQPAQEKLPISAFWRILRQG